MIVPAGFFAVLAYGLVVFLTEKTVATLHFGTRKWPRWLWVMLTFGLSPAFLVSIFWSDAAQLREYPFAVAAVFFSIKFLEDGEPWDALFPFAVVAGQFFLKIKVPVFEWVMLAAVGLFFLKKAGRFSPHGFFEKSPFWAAGLVILAQYFQLGISTKNWDWSRVSPVFLPFWPIFGLFMPICLFFLKKTDLNTLPKSWLAAAAAASVLSAALWPFSRATGMLMAWFGLAVLAFPVFERGLLYGLVFVKKWKVWAIAAGFAALQLVVLWLVFYQK